MSDFTVRAEGAYFALYAGEKPALTPARLPLHLPTKALAEAIAEEYKATPKAVNKLLTPLAHTAIDRIARQEAGIVEALLIYVDTDTLSYRAPVEGEGGLAQLQKAQWDPVLAWVGKRFGVTWETTGGIMPIDQQQELHEALRSYLLTLDAMRLSACSFLASGLSSLALALAVMEGHIDAPRAFGLSRLEEEWQAERWGRDSEAEQRAARLGSEVAAAGRFLRLLETV